MARKVLVIDDHPETRDIIAGVLRSDGFRVLTAVNGRSGIELAKNEQPHLIVVDGMMPDITGWEVTRQLRQLSTFSHTPIVMFTAADDAEQKLAGFEAGVDDYMIKPVQPDQFLLRVHEMLNSRYGPPPVTGPVAEPEPARPKSYIFGVMGSRGGVGTTTVATNLAVVFSALKMPTTLLDFDPQGHIAIYLNQKPNQNQGVDVLADMSDITHIPHIIDEHLQPYRPNLHLLLARPLLNGRSYNLTSGHTEMILDGILRHTPFAVVDLGRGDNPAHEPVLDRAATILFCLSPERISLAVGRLRLADLKRRLPPAASLHALLVSFNGKRLNTDAIAKFINHPISAQLIATPAEMTTAVNKAKPILLINPRGAFTQQIVKIGRGLKKQIA